MAQRVQSENDEQLAGKVCPVCSEDLTRWQIAELPCEHVFHFCCIMDYLDDELHETKTCPICGRDFLVIALIKQILGPNAFGLFRKIILDEPKTLHERSDVMRINNLLIDIKLYLKHKEEQQMSKACSDVEDADEQMELDEDEEQENGAEEDESNDDKSVEPSSTGDAMSDDQSLYEMSSMSSLNDLFGDWEDLEHDWDPFEEQDSEEEEMSDDTGAFMDSSEEELDQMEEDSIDWLSEDLGMVSDFSSITTDEDGYFVVMEFTDEEDSSDEEDPSNEVYPSDEADPSDEEDPSDGGEADVSSSDDY